MQRIARALGRFLGEETMGLLALSALALALAPFFFELSAEEHRVLRGFEWAVVGVFALEYVVDLVLAPAMVTYVLDPWRLLDLAIIGAPVAGLFLPESNTLNASPALRLLRVVFILGVGARMRSRVTSTVADERPKEPRGAEAVTILEKGRAIRSGTFDELLQAAGSKDAWFHGASLSAEHLAETARSLGIDPRLLAQTLDETEYPRLEVFERASAIFTWLPHVDGISPTVHRNGLVILAAPAGVVSISQQSFDGIARLELELARFPAETPFETRVFLALLEAVLHRYERVAGHFERRLRALELVPVRESRPEFLEETFKTQRQLAFVKSDLWRLKGILAALAEGRSRFQGISGDAHEFVRALADEAGYVYETVFNTREGILGLIDLHLNVVSFEMNKVMRMLAVLSALGLVPAVAGGLLGMNLQGNPWPVTLGQVSYGVVVTMALFVYTFYVKGWLR